MYHDADPMEAKNFEDREDRHRNLTAKINKINKMNLILMNETGDRCARYLELENILLTLILNYNLSLLNLSFFRRLANVTDWRFYQLLSL